MQASTIIRVLIVAAALCSAGVCAAGDPMDRYSVVWLTPSVDSSGSMPLGNGDIGVNLWVEENGDLLFYVGKTDAWSENGRLLKLGRIRIRFSPNPFAKGLPFSQTLRLNRGEIDISAGAGPAAITSRIWVDANDPVIHVEAVGRSRYDVQVTLETWRTAERAIEGRELFSAYGMDGAPHPVIQSPDTVQPASGNRIAWFHRNSSSIWRETLELQGMGERAKQHDDPLLNLTFGGVIKGDGFVTETPGVLRSAEARRRHTISCYVLTKQTPTVGDWVQAIDRLIAGIEAKDPVAARSAHIQWWNDFWKRSWVRVSGAEDTEVVMRGYVLQRFINACGGRGAYPIKFNGSIFTVDSRLPDEEYDADYRRWGGPYWFQNTRLPYWPMLVSGDFDAMQPLFRMYLDALPLARERTRLYFGHDGAFFPETMYFWGSYANSNYGWNRDGRPIAHVDNTFIRWYYSGGLELLAMMLDYHALTQDRGFARGTLMPLADAIVEFYEKHYPRDEEGRVLLKPAQSLETWPQAVNPLPDVAGLRFVLQGLLNLPPDVAGDQRREGWARLLTELPPLPIREANGKRVLAAAAQILAPRQNSENPELYAIFPYRLFGVRKPDLEMARLTFDNREVKGNSGWQQDDTQAAFLGLAAEARQRVASRFASTNPGSRFPAFWGPNFDWIPDQDHGCNGLMALQTMLLQWDGSRMLLFPAWPKAWDVEFRVHAPMNTTVEGVYRAGRLERLTVTPVERADDVTVLEPQ